MLQQFLDNISVLDIRNYYLTEVTPHSKLVQDPFSFISCLSKYNKVSYNSYASHLVDKSTV